MVAEAKTVDRITLKGIQNKIRIWIEKASLMLSEKE